MKNKAINMSVSRHCDAVQQLSTEELASVSGGSLEFWHNDNGANFDNSGDYRDGMVQFAGAALGLVAVGIGVATAPVSLPLAALGAAAAGAVAGLTAADAQADMANARPDEPAHDPTMTGS